MDFNPYGFESRHQHQMRVCPRVMLLKVHPSGGGKGEPALYMRVPGRLFSSQFESDYPQLSQSNSKNKECGVASYKTCEVATKNQGSKRQ